MPTKSSFLDKVLGRIARLDTHGLQTVIERLARERAFLETLFNTIEDGILVVDENGRILYFNRAVTQLLGVAEEEAEGMPLGRLLPDLDWESLAGMDQEGGGRVIRHELEISYPQFRYLRLYAAPLDGEEGGASGVALILHDATEARQKTVEEIESSRLHALTLLSGSVAHEIGNPLNALHIHLQLMEREVRKLQEGLSRRRMGGELEVAKQAGGKGRPERLKQDLEPLQAVGRMQSFLDVAKGEIGRLDYIITEFLQAIRPSQPKLEWHDLNDVVRETLELLAPELENRGHAVEEHLDRQLPKAMMDSARTKQVLVNLVKNAMQAMAGGGLLVIRTGAGQDEIWVSITDTGGGIPEEKLKRIFEPFFTTKEKGSGLGLMIVQRIVREHGGRIEVDSRSGQGTTFKIWLPMRERQTRLLEARL